MVTLTANEIPDGRRHEGEFSQREAPSGCRQNCPEDSASLASGLRRSIHRRQRRAWDLISLRGVAP